MMEWSVAKIESLCDVFTDGDWIESKNQATEGVRLIQTGNVGEGKFKDRRDKSRFISEDTFSELKCCEIFEGDCLVSRLPDPVGRSCILPETGDRMITAVDCSILRFKKDQLTPDFFNYFSQSNTYLNIVESLTSGATRKRISRKNLGLVEIPLPPISEQKCIVAILDQAFADIEQARAKTEQNLKNSRELFESYLQQVFSQRGEGWEELTLGQATGGVCTGPFGSLLHKSDYIENGIPLVNPAHITMTGIETDSRKTVSKENAARLSNYVMRQGDIVIGRRGEMGRCALITEKEDGFLCGTGSFLIRASDRFHAGYLVRYLRSANCKARLEKIAGGAVMPNLSNTDLSNLNLFVPPIDKQNEIIELIDLLAIESETIVSIYQKKLEALNELKKSILQKAFSGELTKAPDKEINIGEAV